MGRGINRVPYLDFRNAALHMGLNMKETRLAWAAYRPPEGCQATALEFHEFDPAEWDNLNQLLELFWDEFNFDMEVIWRMFCRGDECATLDVFQAGLKKMGFQGDCKHIFYAMDTGGRGHLWKEDLNYLLILQPESHGNPEENPLVLELMEWIERCFASPNEFCDRLGLKFGGVSMTVHSFARKLDFLKYPGNCLHTALVLSRCNHFIGREDLVHIITGREKNKDYDVRLSRSYAGRCMFKPRTADNAFRQKLTFDIHSEKPPWNEATFDPAPFNQCLGKRERHVFSMPYPRPIRDGLILDKKKVKRDKTTHRMGTSSYREQRKTDPKSRPTSIASPRPQSALRSTSTPTTPVRSRANSFASISASPQPSPRPSPR